MKKIMYSRRTVGVVLGLLFLSWCVFVNLTRRNQAKAAAQATISESFTIPDAAGALYYQAVVVPADFPTHQPYKVPVRYVRTGQVLTVYADFPVGATCGFIRTETVPGN